MTRDYREEELVYTLALTRIKTITPYDARKLLDGFPCSRDIFMADRNSLIRVLEPRKNVAALAETICRYKDFDWAKKEIERAQKLGSVIISFRDGNYPQSLRFITDPPPVLYVKGEIKPEDTVAVGMVGTRRASAYGITSTVKITRELVDYDVTIVSGLARGIDSAAHHEAIAFGGRTIAVMATGIDITYPSENRKLRERIEGNGAVVTEFPIGSTPCRWNFPIRNRIISGLSLGCVVVEAPEKSGALITARLCSEYNREVFAVPGNITSSRSRGCNKLIREGAKPVGSAEDILEEFDIDFEKRRRKEKQAAKLTGEEKIILDAIGEDGAVGEIIIQKCPRIPPFKVSSLLMTMELKGLLKKLPGNIYARMTGFL